MSAMKRHFDEEALSVFISKAKRRRLEEGINTATILKFEGQIKKQDDSATTQFARNYLSVQAYCYDNDEYDNKYDSEDSNQENYFGNYYSDDDGALNSDSENDHIDDKDDATKSLYKDLEKFGDEESSDNGAHRPLYIQCVKSYRLAKARILEIPKVNNDDEDDYDPDFEQDYESDTESDDEQSTIE